MQVYPETGFGSIFKNSILFFSELVQVLIHFFPMSCCVILIDYLVSYYVLFHFSVKSRIDIKIMFIKFM